MSRINEGKTIGMTTDNKDIPKCELGHNHEWKVLQKPEINNSGWHTNECVHCGLKSNYDTTD